jgi:hypothetical protein
VRRFRVRAVVELVVEAADKDGARAIAGILFAPSPNIGGAMIDHTEIDRGEIEELPAVEQGRP